MKKMRIDLYTHFFKVSHVHPSAYYALRRAFQELLQVQFVKIRGKVQKQNKNIFAAKSDEGEYRFHINYLPRFKEMLRDGLINDDEINYFKHEYPEPAEIDVKVPEKFQMRDYQEEAISYILDEGRSKLISLATGMGKGVLLNTLIKIPNGWKAIGDIKVGDYVNTPNGDKAKVTGVYDNKQVPCYKITFADGRNIVCDKDHLWEVYNQEWGEYRTIDTEMLFRCMDSEGMQFDIPLVDPTHSADEIISLPEDPYFLGKRYLNLESIPDIYLTASFEQRLALLKGIVDNNINNDLSLLVGSSEKLHEQLLELFRSIGCITTSLIKNSEFGVQRYIRVSAQIPSLLGCKESSNGTILRLPITSITPMDSQDTRCIKVDHPDSMYVIQDYICTHNTVTAAKAGELLGYRTIIIVLGRYKEKWRDDILELYGPGTNFILVKGLAQLLSIIEQAKEGNPVPDVIIVTTTTMQLYIKEWEKHQGKEIEGMVPPEEMYEILKIGYRIIDEAHQHFHMVFKNDLYSNLYKAVYLTATLESNDKFIQAMYNLIWPRAMRGQAVKPAPYDKTTALLYQHLNPDRVRWKSNQGYSHVMYEQSIWKHIPSRVEYLDMIGDVVEQKFLPLYEPGKKMLIFCSLVDTCKEVADYLNQRFKDKKWQISKFTAEDNKEIIDTNDITVSTLGKAGTALDISGLIVCFNTVALAEPKANLQAKGRLRDLSKKPGFEHIVPEYIYTVATDIPRHVQYHQEKKMLFAGRTTRITEERAQYTIGQSLGEYFRLNLKAHWDHIKMENLKLHDKTK